jgi:glutamyl-tRNA synthetase/glutamyl-Q tRNA(Asp) synthetase
MDAATNTVALFMAEILSRFAPAPTGFLHLGHVVNAVFVWGITRRLGGRVLLRIEDHDRVRSRPEFETAILEDLEWLGFAADGPMTRQSERSDIYVRALNGLRDRGLVYACGCSRAARYPGTCRDKHLPQTPRTGSRIRLDPSTETFTDWRHGVQQQRPFEQCGDLLARDRDRNWTYQFTATVDDMAQHVTLVIRGDDLLSSTGRQLQLARLLGRESPPDFMHHPLIMKSPTQKLSKSDGDTGVRELRAQGWTPGRVIGRACEMAGLISSPRDVRAGEVSSMMDAFTGEQS